MGMDLSFREYYQPSSFIDLHGITPIKTEPLILRSLAELISAQGLTQQFLATQLGSIQAGRSQAGQPFIRQGQRADEASGFDSSTEQVRMLTQRIEDLEKRLDEATKGRAATVGK